MASQQEEIVTEAGRALYAELHNDERWIIDSPDPILAIEREARAPLDVERLADFIRDKIESEPYQGLHPELASMGLALAIRDEFPHLSTEPAPFDEKRLARAMTVSLDIYGWDLEAMARDIAAEYAALSNQPSTTGPAPLDVERLGHVAEDGRLFHEALCVHCGLMLAYLVRDQVRCFEHQHDIDAGPCDCDEPPDLIERWYAAFEKVSGQEATTPDGRARIYGQFHEALLSNQPSTEPTRPDAERLFRAYWRARWDDGDPVPQWEQLPEKKREWWRKVAADGSLDFAAATEPAQGGTE